MEDNTAILHIFFNMIKYAKICEAIRLRVWIIDEQVKLLRQD
jgi:hypothetical protein